MLLRLGGVGGTTTRSSPLIELLVPLPGSGNAHPPHLLKLPRTPISGSSSDHSLSASMLPSPSRCQRSRSTLRTMKPTTPNPAAHLLNLPSLLLRPLSPHLPPKFLFRRARRRPRNSLKDLGSAALYLPRHPIKGDTNRLLLSQSSAPLLLLLATGWSARQQGNPVGRLQVLMSWVPRILRLEFDEGQLVVWVCSLVPATVVRLLRPSDHQFSLLTAISSMVSLTDLPRIPFRLISSVITVLVVSRRLLIRLHSCLPHLVKFSTGWTIFPSFPPKKTGVL
jgi:hypothetical protein